MQPTRYDPFMEALTELAGFVIVAIVVAGLSLGAVHSLRMALPRYQEAAPRPAQFEQYLPRYPGERYLPIPPGYDDAQPPAQPHKITLPPLDARARPGAPAAWLA